MSVFSQCSLVNIYGIDRCRSLLVPFHYKFSFLLFHLFFCILLFIYLFSLLFFFCFNLASLGAGDFTIQGATDGNSDFKIQGATDGHSNFQIQGPSQGAISTFNVQPPTDGHSQSIIRGPYDANHQAATKSLQYNDPSGKKNVLFLDSLSGGRNDCL